MQNMNIIVKFLPIKNCFILVPSTLLRQVSTEVAAVALNYGEKIFYLSAAKSQPSPNEFLCMSPILGKHLNIEAGSEVSISFVADPPSLTKIHVVPSTPEDYDIVSCQAAKVQSTLLDQIAVVSPGQPIVVWLSKFMTATLVIESISPKFQYGKLDNHTEVHVIDAKDHKTPAAKEIIPENQTDFDAVLKNHEIVDLPPIFRVCPLSLDKKYTKTNDNTQLSSPHNIFLTFRQLNKLFPGRSIFSMAYGKIETIFTDRESINSKFTLNGGQEYHSPRTEGVIVSLLSAEEFFNEEFLGESEDHIWMSEILKKHLNIHWGSKIHIEPVEVADHPINSIQLFSKLNSEDLFRNYVKKFSQRTDLILQQNSKILIETGNCTVKISPESSPYVLLNEEKLKNLEIEVVERIVEEPENEEVDEDQSFSSENLYWNTIKEAVEGSSDILRMSLATSEESRFERRNILICGGVGTGRTTALHCIKKIFKNPPYFYHTHLIDCRSLKGKKAESVSKLVTSVLQECALYQPSVVLLDNVDSITFISGYEEEPTPEQVNAMMISEMLSHLISLFQREHLISMVVTSTERDRLGPGLRPREGVHVFSAFFDVKLLDAQDRTDFIRFLLRNHKISNDINWEAFREKTEGWVVQDFIDFYDKARYIVWKGRETLTEVDLMSAINSIKPLSLYNVPLFKGEGYSWDDVGGLDDVKQTLRSLLKWPLQYSEFYATAGVHHDNSILLYGMPGTGKTLIAGAIPQECKLNFINVKGPELLSKYIGGSEEAVRAVFEKAKRIRPCVIFFDEFESLAPRRGHDSTGVTDRVVNMLLTQFDGVEGREGIGIVVATSRPDLLDPAILRPGRIDRSLLCPLPDAQTRAKILEILCKRDGIDVEGFDFELLGEMTYEYSGADLTSVLNQAKINAYSSVLDELKKGTMSCDQVKITQEMMVSACEKTHPSLTQKEMAKYYRVYNQFSGAAIPQYFLQRPKSTLA